MSDRNMTAGQPIVFARFPRGAEAPSITLIFRPSSASLNDETQISIPATDLDSESLVELDRFIEAARPSVLAREAFDPPSEAIIDEPARDPSPMADRMKHWSHEAPE